MADHSTTHQDAHNSGEIKSKTAFVSSFWFVIILVGLFIAALNFIEVMGNSEEGHKNHEATASETLKGETGLGRVENDTAQQHSAVAPAHDSAQHEGHQ